MLCNSSGEDEGSCGAVVEVGLAGNGVGVYVSLCALAVCVNYTVRKPMVSLPPSLIAFKITFESVAGAIVKGDKGGVCN